MFFTSFLPASSPGTAVLNTRTGSWGRVSIACLLALACALSGCGPDTEKDRAAIQALIDQEVIALNSEDLRALSEVWSQDDDITLVDVPPPGRFVGWNDIAKVFGNFFAQTSDIQVTVDDVKIRLSDEVAYATYGWSMVGRFGDRPLIDRGQATAIYRRGEEGWRLVHAHFSPVPPALALEVEKDPPPGDDPPPDGEPPADGEKGGDGAGAKG